MATLDPELDLLLVEKEFYEKNPSAGKLPVGADDPLYISLKFSGEIEALKEAGLTVGTTVGDIAYGVTNLAGLAALAQHPKVEFIRKQRRSRIHLDESVPDIKAQHVWGRSGDNFSGYTGRGVIVGIIDTGIDFRHHTFRKADANGTTRVIKIWDQTLTADPTLPAANRETVPGAITHPTISPPGSPTPLGYGVEYSEAQINATMQSSSSRPAPVPVRHVDTYGHGTHVAGIAAGDGSQAGSCHGGYHYVGVAPEADLIVVRLWGLTEGDASRPPTPNGVEIDAIRYILNEARILSKPVAINLSLGLFSEVMDGTSADCLAVDRLLTANSVGRAVVFAAGNNGDMEFHATGSIPSGPPNNTLELNFEIFPDDTKIRFLVVVYSGASLEAQLTSQLGGVAEVLPWTASGAAARTSATANGGGLVTVLNNPDRISIAIRPPPVTPATVPPTNQPNAAGTWKLELRNTGAGVTNFDAFCLYGSTHDPKSPHFLDHITTLNTLDETGSGFESISVGSYRIGGGLSVFSARGPTLEVPSRTKPEICAPGESITSAGLPQNRTGCQSCCCECCQNFYENLNGTSMSAPHITGLIALMLHKNPTLTHIQIKAALRANAAPKPADSTPDENEGWGAGKADAQQTVGAVAQVNPPVTPLLAAPLPAPFVALHKQLLATERGPELAGLFEKYAREMMGLITQNKRVATVWHRCRGPIWVRLALRAAYAPRMRVPLEADGLSLHEGIRRLGEILQRYASAPLLEDWRRHEADLALITDGMTLEEIIQVVGNRSQGARFSRVLAEA
jgi:subtilisin family serine protease